MELKGSKTEANLMAAFAGESQARNKYTYYAGQARKDGFVHIAEIFEETANNEREHAKLWLKHLHGGKLPGTEANLKDAAAGENYEYEEMYPEFAKVAHEEGFSAIAKQFEQVSLIEKSHADRYLHILANVQNKRVFEKSAPVTWYCSNCGYLHEDTKAPESCPVCVHPQSFFYPRNENYR
ncbi:MAG: rubrerythrin family protein [Defluviitaleaceae bacterium]|nr:rubrerythrin family protein [Defluviitaleaceae bacterium]